MIFNSCRIITPHKVTIVLMIRSMIRELVVKHMPEAYNNAAIMEDATIGRQRVATKLDSRSCITLVIRK